MPNARDIITLAAKEAGVLGVGQTLLAEDTNDIFILLKRMAAQWQRKRWLVPSLTDIATISNGNLSNPIGDGQFWNYPRPDKIQGGYIVQLNTGNTPISLPLYPIFSYEDWIEITVKNLNSLPDHFFYDAQYPVGNVFIWPIAPAGTYEIHLLIKSQIGLENAIKTGNIFNAGSGYTNGVYVAVPLAPVTPGDPAQQFQSFGTGATATITVAGGVITNVVILNGGETFKVNDLLTCANTNLGGTGNGFTYLVTDVSANLDAEINMPPENEEPLHYNLALRICSAYQIEPQDQTVKLARAGLNTLRIANTQVPTLRMPDTLRRGKSFNIYNADGY